MPCSQFRRICKLVLPVLNSLEDRIVDDQDPRALMEAAEAQPAPEVTYDDGILLVRAMMCWILNARTMGTCGLRAWCAAYVATPAVVEGITLAEIAAKSGYGRSAAHNLVRDFETKFGVKSNHARSAKARATYSEAYARAHPSKPDDAAPALVKP
jgi:hypothetical protein